MTTDRESNSSEPLFREEAMDEYSRGRLQGKLLRISPAWADWVFWLLMATVAGTAAFLFLAKIDQVVTGPAIVRQSSSSTSEALEVLALLPGNSRPEVHKSQAMSVRWNGASFPSLVLEVQDIASEIVGPERALALLGAELAGIVELEGPVVFVRAAIPPEPASSASLVPGTSGVAEVRIGTHRLIEELLPGVRP